MKQHPREPKFSLMLGGLGLIMYECVERKKIAIDVQEDCRDLCLHVCILECLGNP